MISAENSKWFYAPSVLSGIALMPLPYEYYSTILRPVLWISSAFIALMFYRQKGGWNPYSVLFVMIFFAYNPIIPIHMSRMGWFPINVVCVLLFAWIAYAKPLSSKDAEQ